MKINVSFKPVFSILSTFVIIGIGTTRIQPVYAECGIVDVRSCGSYNPEASVWYPVYVETFRLSEMQNYYGCEDAFVRWRNQTGKYAVQVASFDNFQEALNFAVHIGGEVGEPNVIK